jgi:hypothetical protein
MYDDGWSVFEILTLDADIFYNIFLKKILKQPYIWSLRPPMIN